MKMNIPGQDEIDDPIILDRIRAQRQADLDLAFNSTNPFNPNRKTASMGLDELRAAVVQANGGVVPDSGRGRPLTAAQSLFLETARQEKLATDALAQAATSQTMKSVEEHGYLYHYAPREARESILKEGMRPSQARTAIADITGPMSHHSTHVPENSLYFFTDPNYAPSAEQLFDGGRPDMYRVKIEPGMLDNMAVDPRVPIVGGRGSAVILPIKGDSIFAELLAVDVEFDYGAESGTIKGRTFLSDSQRARVQPVIKTTTHGKAVDPRSVTPVQKAKPQAVLPVTQHANPLINIPGHGQVIDPIEIATRRAKRQKDLNVAFNQTQVREVNAQRKAALPLKKANKAQRRAAKNAKALEVQKQREEGSKLARAEAERLKAQQAAQRVTQPKTVSSSGAKKTKTSLKTGKITRTEPIYVNAVTRQQEGRLEFVGNRKGKLKVGQTREGSMDRRVLAGQTVYVDGAPSYSRRYTPTIDAPTYEAYGSISDGSPKKIEMSQEEAVDYISKRVDIDGGTLARNKSLPGFGQGVKDIVDQGILSKEEVSKIVQSKNILELTHSTSLSQYFRPTNAGQVADALDLEELYRLSYGQALSASQQGVGMGKGEQIKIGRAIGLGEKQGMMVDHENLVKGHNAALKELYDADRAQKIADGARNQQNIQATKLADEEQRIAANNLAKAEAKTARKIQATISQGSSEVGETILHSPMAPAAEQAKEVIRKAPISKRTMEKMMSSNMLAAGVAAGGLGLIYASNRMKGEREVGR